jgi:hypothetical protein
LSIARPSLGLYTVPPIWADDDRIPGATIIRRRERHLREESKRSMKVRPESPYQRGVRSVAQGLAARVSANA